AALQPKAQNAGGRVSCQAPTVWVAVADPRGLRGASIRLAGRTLELQPGTGHSTWKDGLHAELPAALADGGALELNVALDLVGTAELALVPAARSAQWKLASDWPHPSFGGRFLPVTREVRSDGFDARWSVSALASNASQLVEQPDGDKPRLAALDTLAVTFTDPVNPYV
ncbi:hypothetical protein CLD22_31015, partial [Rubrivivax gelatinosus]|nr:hypothetical protein [Rubrivivax gelatinosus]